MRSLCSVSAAIIVALVTFAPAVYAQVDPAGTSTSASDTTGTATATDATADPNATPLATDATDTAATAVTDIATQVPEPAPVWRLHIPGVELETEAWLLPLFAFGVALLLSLIFHYILASVDVAHWPDSGGSWWKLRFVPFLVAAAILITTYFLFVRGLDEEVLRIAGSRCRNWLYVYATIVTAVWLFVPRPRVPAGKLTAQGDPT